MSIHVGIDVGSASVKAAIVSTDPADAPFFDACGGEAGVFGSARELRDGLGRPAWLAVARPALLTGNPAGQARALLDRVTAGLPAGALGSIAATGSGAGLLAGVEPRHEFQALSRATELLLPSVRTLFEIGGETSKYIRFEPLPGGTGHRLGIADYQTNGDCAAGTGAFLDQQAGAPPVPRGGDRRDRAGDEPRGPDRGALLGLRQERHDPRAAEGVLARGDPPGAVRRGGPQLPQRRDQGAPHRARRGLRRRRRRERGRGPGHRAGLQVGGGHPGRAGGPRSRSARSARRCSRTTRQRTRGTTGRPPPSPCTARTRRCRPPRRSRWRTCCCCASG